MAAVLRHGARGLAVWRSSTLLRPLQRAHGDSFPRALIPALRKDETMWPVAAVAALAAAAVAFTEHASSEAREDKRVSKREPLRMQNATPQQRTMATRAVDGGNATAASPAEQRAGVFRADLPTFSREELKRHVSPADGGVWVAYGDGVYDVTEFITQHPGGNKLLMAAGGNVEPYWRLYAQHKVDYVYELLETMRIGNVEPLPPGQEMADTDNPFAGDPERHPALIVHTAQPFNAEPPAALLVDSPTTPNDIFYVRNHLPVPHVDVDAYCVNVEGPTPASFAMDQLKESFAHAEITVTLQCAGNRRQDMDKYKALKGTPWRTGAASTATFTGVRLADVLRACGVRHSAEGLHVHFEGLDAGVDGERYGASIPLTVALNPANDVLLAWSMNGEPLSADHGFPLRVIVPGTIGARSVKWLSRIVVSKNEYPGFWQQKDYKMFSPTVEAQAANYDSEEAIQDFPVQSAICDPGPNSLIEIDDDGEGGAVATVAVRGYALAGGGRGIRRVEVSADDGESWHAATLHPTPTSKGRAWAWTLWEAEVPLPMPAAGQRARHVFTCRAVDTACNVQPASVKDIWNIRGLNNNVWHRVPVEVSHAGATNADTSAAEASNS